MRRRFRRSSDSPEELNITAFMNLMVILVPFLLITAVFSRITILELNLPPAASAGENAKKNLQLEVIVRKNALELNDQNGSFYKRFDNNGNTYNLAALSQYLRHIKARLPDKSDASILLEEDISYDTLVKVMDIVRASGGAELFPDISIGDAPGTGASADKVTAKKKGG